MFYQRLTWLRIILPLVFLVFVGRLAFLQVVHGFELRRASERNHLRWVRLPAPRGLILDRKGRVLATNVPGMGAWLVPGEVERTAWPELLRRLTALGFYPDRKTAEAALADFRRFPSYLPVRLASNLDIAAISRLEEELPFLPGVYLRSEPVRSYPYGALAAHLLGYLREIDGDELAALRDRGYRLGDRLGKAGVERGYESSLRGEEGGEQVEVDALGHVTASSRHVEPRAGDSVTLTLDLDVQQAAESAMQGRVGAAVAVDPSTGDVLAMVSAPNYDLNRMSGRISPEMAAWLYGPQRPELNRVTGGVYPPGSVFKIVTAAAAMEKGVVGANAYYYCPGEYRGIHCWKHVGHGTISFTGAVAQSCNVAFMQMAEKTGIAALTRMADRFGLGHAVALRPRVQPLISEKRSRDRLVGLIPEQRGLVPGPEWAKRVRHSPWMLGETLQVGIGQSSLGITPLQAARIIAAFANGGKLIHPRVAKSVGRHPEPASQPTPIGLKVATMARIAHGLRAVAEGEGTAHQLDPTLRIAGKTGTAQNPRGQDHAWFVGFAPADAPKVAVVVLVEHGGHGGATAAPIAQEIIRTALNGPPPPSTSTAPTP